MKKYEPTLTVEWPEGETPPDDFDPDLDGSFDGIVIKIEEDEDGSFYLASEADARIAEMRKAFETSSTDEENKLRTRVTELEKALQEIKAFSPGNFRPLEDEIKIYDIASRALAKSCL